MRRKLLLIGLPALALLAACHAAYWAWATSQLETGLARWITYQRAAGWHIEAGAPTRGGWPFHASAAVAAVRLAGGEAALPGGIAWQAERLALQLDLAAPQTLHLRAAGRQALRVGTGPEVPFTAEQFDLSFPLVAGPDAWAELRAAGIHLQANGQPATIATLRARADFRPFAPAGEAAVTLTAQAGPADVPPELAPELGPRIETIAVTLALRGPLPPQPEPSRRAAQAWRDGRGRLDISDLRLRWGPFKLAGEANLQLDNQLQPAGRGKSRVSGHNAAVDALARAELLPRQLAGTAKAMMGLASRPTGPGGVPEVEIPLSLRDRTLAVGQFPLGRFAPLAWTPP